MKKLIGLSLLSFFAFNAEAQKKMKADLNESKLNFSIFHDPSKSTKGSFKLTDVKVNSKKDDDLSNSQIEFSVDAASVNTENAQRDEHLKKPDFFEVEKYPAITFKSAEVKAGTEKDTYEISGDLTIKSVTKRETFIASRTEMKDGKQCYKVSGKIDSAPYGLKWGKPESMRPVDLDCIIVLVKE
jgi:polyisoprenoid-binding protein YceI